MLTVKKSTTLSGEIKFDGVLVAILQASISNEDKGNTYINQTIINQEVYNEHKKECRTMVSEFQEKAYEVEDEFLMQSEKETKK